SAGRPPGMESMAATGTRLIALAALTFLGSPAAPAVAETAASAELAAATGTEIYRAACAACHGADGRGAPAHQVAFEEALPDFTDCSFATREPDADWLAVAHQGGPARAFSPMMPAFGEALAEEQLLRALSHVRTFCADRRWPRGELNLPLALFTEKAYPEDEVVWRTGMAVEGPGEVANRFVFEKRLGARHQIEVIVPTAWREATPSDGATGPDGSSHWSGGLGDVAVGAKRVLFHSLERGSILSLAGEVVLPTGDEEDGLGRGVTIFEPFVAYGQILPADAFLQFQGGLELPLDSDIAEEAFWRLAVGRTWSAGGWGRAVSPRVELRGARELASGEDVLWDAVPQVQVSLSTRQHVLANVGLRVPLNETAGRDTQVVIYLLWDWFDGGFFQGW
ncbi:MAG TPA: c-type cytochrome, partial [Thermoanaerobaculia bacterium]|nr:c-type cytochrome [Thermoanaerobaculia bacterium]